MKHEHEILCLHCLCVFKSKICLYNDTQVFVFVSLSMFMCFEYNHTPEYPEVSSITMGSI